MTFKAKYLPIHRGQSGWVGILGGGAQFPRLEEAVSADFAIIGAGFAGLAAARWLKQLDPQARIIVLEAEDIAEGASGRNSGFMIDLPHDLQSEDYAGGASDQEKIRLNRKAADFAENMVEDFEIDPHYFDKAGKINGAASPKAHAHNVSYAQHLSTIGENSEMLDAKTMHEITGSHHYHSGLFTKGTVMLQPAGFVRGLANGLCRDGVAFYTNSPALSFEKLGQSWQIQTPKGKVKAGKIILTVNGHLASFGFHVNALMQIFLFASMTQELSADSLGKLGGHSRWGIVPSDPMGTTMRRIDSAQGGNRIITRTCSVLHSDMQVRARDLGRARKVMRKKFDQRFPNLKSVNMEYAWSGHLCLTLNGVAVAGEIDNGVYSGCVQNGLGTTRGILTGIAAAESACGKTSDIREYFSEQEEPKKLPPEPFREWGANAYMRWREQLASKE